MDLWQQKLLRAMRHAVLTCGFVFRLDRRGMLTRLASLKGSSLRRPALARGLFIAGLAIALSCAGSIKATANQKPFHVMNIKLYAYNKLNWTEFQCYNWLIIAESNWNYRSRNGSHYGLGQMRSKWYGTLNPYEQIDAHITYIRYRYGDACKAYKHWENKGWH
jgi:hypothetical protein